MSGINTDDFYIESGLSNVNENLFSNRNLIIGKNGSGKTRFLKTLEKSRRYMAELQNQRINLVTLYFPEIHSYYNQLDGSTPPEEYESIFDFLKGEANISFCDFLKALEDDRMRFGNNLIFGYMMEGRIQREIKNIVKRINEFLTILLHKNIEVDKVHRQIYILNAANEKQTLEKALQEFSPGELMLFYLALFITAIENKNYSDLILILDEPELHLHPKALLSFIELLQKNKSIKELWVASHSIFLLSKFDFSEVIFIDNSEIITKNSSMYKSLYDSLIGIDDIDTFELLSSIENWQFYNFIVECFCRPEVIGKENTKDEQFVKFLNQIKTISQNRPIEILDYGAGKCRIWDCLKSLQAQDIELPQISYTAIDPHPDEKIMDQLNNTKNTKSNTLKSSYYTKIQEIPEYGSKFDFVILMNVLHEIPADQWKTLFDEIYQSLTDNGILIFLEVLKLKKGEQPYSHNGYLLLQDEEVRILFQNDNIKNVLSREKEKSNCWIIEKEQLKNVSPGTIKKCLQKLKTNCENELRTKFREKIKAADEDKRSTAKKILAREYAFLSQQYINVKYALEDLDTFPQSHSNEKSCTENTLNKGVIRVKGINK